MQKKKKRNLSAKNKKQQQPLSDDKTAEQQPFSQGEKVSFFSSSRRLLQSPVKFFFDVPATNQTYALTSTQTAHYNITAWLLSCSYKIVDPQPLGDYIGYGCAPAIARIYVLEGEPPIDAHNIPSLNCLTRDRACVPFYLGDDPKPDYRINFDMDLFLKISLPLLVLGIFASYYACKRYHAPAAVAPEVGRLLRNADPEDLPLPAGRDVVQQLRL